MYIHTIKNRFIKNKQPTWTACHVSGVSLALYTGQCLSLVPWNCRFEACRLAQAARLPLELLVAVLVGLHTSYLAPHSDPTVTGGAVMLGNFLVWPWIYLENLVCKSNSIWLRITVRRINVVYYIRELGRLLLKLKKKSFSKGDKSFI